MGLVDIIDSPKGVGKIFVAWIEKQLGAIRKCSPLG